MTKEQMQIAMYGCTIADMRAEIEDSITAKLSGYAMVAMSILSDAQEEMERGMTERARQSINRAKWVIRTYCWTDPTDPRLLNAPLTTCPACGAVQPL